MPRYVEITLTTHQQRWVCSVGVERRLLAIRKNRTPYYGAPKTDQWRMDIEGAAGEFCAALVLNLHWDGDIGSLTSDVGQVQVRLAYTHDRRLCMHESDADDLPYVLVTGQMPTYRVQGWIYGREGKNREWWGDPQGTNRPAFWVPQNALRGMDEFPEEWRGRSL